MYFRDEYRWGEVLKERRKTFEKDHIVRGAGVALSPRHREGPSPTFQINFILPGSIESFLNQPPVPFVLP